nr:polysaccharide biosynthesis C-terminal domain-containing protein [Planosporangium thailandense]
MVIAAAARTVLLGARGGDTVNVTRVTRCAVAISSCSCLGVTALAPIVLPIFFGEPFRPAVLPTTILAVGTVLYTGMTCMTAILLVEGRPRSSSRSLVIGSALGVVLLLALSPLGAIGAALASLAGYGLSLAIAWRALSRLGTSYGFTNFIVLNSQDLIALRHYLWDTVSRRHLARASTPKQGGHLRAQSD